MDTGKLRVLAIMENLIPSNIIGIIRPLLKLQSMDKIVFKFQYRRFYHIHDLDDCDVVVLCRSFYILDLRLLEDIKQREKKLIYEIDDNFFELPLSTEIGRYHRNPINLYVLTKMFEHADLIRIYSIPMRKRVEQYNQNIQEINSYFDMSLLQGLSQRPHAGKVKIVYASSKGADQLDNVFVPALNRILTEFGDTVDFYSFGPLPELLKDNKNVHSLAYQRNYEQFIRFFYRQGFDIGLAPLEDDVFHNSKTNNKYREYGAMGVVGIYSNTMLYRSCVVPDQTGLLVENTNDSWYEALKRAIMDENLRRTIKENSFNHVKRDFSFDNAVNDWEKALSQVGYQSPLQRKVFYNIQRLKIAFLCEDENNVLLQLRIKPLQFLTGVAGLDCTLVKSYEIDQKTAKNYDILIYFICTEKDSNRDKLFEYCNLFPFVIADVPVSLNLQGLPDNFYFTTINPCQLHNGRTIPDDYYMSNLDKNAILYYNIVGGEQVQSLKLACTIENNMELYTNKYFSVDHPIVLWADLLEQFQGSKEFVEVGFIRKGLKKILRIATYPVRIAKKAIGKLWGFINTKYQILKRRVHFIVELYRINIKKRY